MLLDQVAAGERAVPLSAEEIRASMAADTALIEIALLEKSAEVWLVTAEGVRHARSEAPRAAIEAAVARHLAAIDAGDEKGMRREGRWLYERLLAPLAMSLPDETTLVVVADGALHALPFATLVDGEGRYLVETHAIGSAPSASIHLRPVPAHSYGTLVAVSQPQPVGLARLGGALAEARQAAREHPRGRWLNGTQASPRELLEAAEEAACVHFAGHAKTDVDHPSRSALLFEAVDGGVIELTASEIASRRLRNAPLIVLAACSTGRGRLRRNEGIQSLAAAFLQAGARGVVATLWDVDDDLSAKLFRSFHQKLREGARPADALRNAQRELMRSDDPRLRSPSVWASVMIEGKT